MKNVMGKRVPFICRLQPAGHIGISVIKEMKKEKLNHRTEKKQILLVTLHVFQKNRIKSREVTGKSRLKPLSLQGRGRDDNQTTKWW